MEPKDVCKKCIHTYCRAVRGGYTEDSEVWEAARRRAKTDLFWLAKDLLGYELVDNFYCEQHPEIQSDGESKCSICGEDLIIYPGNLSIGGSPHREMCAFFVKKNPDLSIAAQDTIKNRLMMCPRGSFKSSIDEADCVQWIIAFPNVRIALLTATDGLGLEFVDKVKSFFILPKDGQGKKQPTKFQLLFPEHTKVKDDEAANYFITPARTPGLQINSPTLHAISLKASTSGWHYDVGKYDDCVSNHNSGPGTTQEQKDNIGESIKLARSLVDPFGYNDNLGTPYDEQDAYAKQLEKLKDEIGKTFKILIRPAWEIKRESLKKKEDELVELDYNLLFPWHMKWDHEKNTYIWTPRLTYGFLRLAAKDSQNFACFPAGCNVLMADWTEKPIEHLKVGEDIVGVDLKTTRKLIPAKIEYIHSEESEVWEVTTNFGRKFYTTPEHKFLREKKRRYGPLKISSKIVSVYELSEPGSEQEKLDLAWLGGIIDGEGTCSTGCVQITQSTTKNKAVCERIELVLNRLGVSFKVWQRTSEKYGPINVYTLHGGRSLKIRLLKYARMAKTQRFVENLWGRPERIVENGRGQRTPEIVIDIKSVGKRVVYNIQSSSGNFICQGIAVKNCQYLCNPASSKLVKFTEQMIRSHITTTLPQTYRAFCAFDLAYSVESGRDYTVGVVGWFDTSGRLFIVDAVRGRYSKGEMPGKIASLAARWQVEILGIENSPGAEYLEEAILREMSKLNFHCPVQFFPVDTQKNAKNIRAEMLEYMFMTDTLWFSSTVDIISQIIDEFVKFKPTMRRKDDCVDAIAHVARYKPTNISEIPKEVQARATAAWKILADKQHYEMIYGYKEPEPEPVMEPIAPSHLDGMPIINSFDEWLYGNQ